MTPWIPHGRHLLQSASSGTSLVPIPRMILLTKALLQWVCICGIVFCRSRGSSSAVDNLSGYWEHFYLGNSRHTVTGCLLVPLYYSHLLMSLPLHVSYSGHRTCCSEYLVQTARCWSAKCRAVSLTSCHCACHILVVVTVTTTQIIALHLRQQKWKWWWFAKQK